MLSFLSFHLKDLIDILLVSIGLFYGYRLMKESGSLRVFTGILIFVLVWLLLSKVFEFRLLGALFDQFIQVGVIGLIIIFQDDVRKFFISLGSHEQTRRIFKFLRKNNKKQQDMSAIMPVALACKSMGEQKVGALIIYELSFPLNEIVASGERLNAIISRRLIENIFFKNSPLHDGAMVIRNRRIEAAGCILPVSHAHDIPPQLGLRHRAALGISQETDAFAIIVSEETGHISVAYRGQFHLDLTPEELERMLAGVLFKGL